MSLNIRDRDLGTAYFSPVLSLGSSLQHMCRLFFTWLSFVQTLGGVGITFSPFISNSPTPLGVVSLDSV
jgi:hypothetical protein